jgi:hypothetical protein
MIHRGGKLPKIPSRRNAEASWNIIDIRSVDTYS